jgi:hypothetical protein
VASQSPGEPFSLLLIKTNALVCRLTCNKPLRVIGVQEETPLAWSPDGRFLAFASGNRSIYILSRGPNGQFDVDSVLVGHVLKVTKFLEAITRATEGTSLIFLNPCSLSIFLFPFVAAVSFPSISIRFCVSPSIRRFLFFSLAALRECFCGTFRPASSHRSLIGKEERERERNRERARERGRENTSKIREKRGEGR